MTCEEEPCFISGVVTWDGCFICCVEAGDARPAARALMKAQGHLVQMANIHQRGSNVRRRGQSRVILGASEGYGLGHTGFEPDTHLSGGGEETEESDASFFQNFGVNAANEPVTEAGIGIGITSLIPRVQ